MEMLDDGAIHVLCGTERGGGTFHHVTQSDVQFQTEGPRVSGILRLVLSDHGWPRVRRRAPRFLPF